MSSAPRRSLRRSLTEILAISVLAAVGFALTGIGYGWDSTNLLTAISVGITIWVLTRPRVVPLLAIPAVQVTGLLLAVVGTHVAYSYDPDVSRSWFFAIFGLATAVSVAAVTGFWRRWAIWRLPPRESAWRIFLSTAGALGMLTIAFAFATLVAAEKDYIGARGQASLASIETFYLWNFLDAVPVLEIPDTLNWQEPSFEVTDHAGGGLLLAYKVLVIVPVIGALVELWDRRRPMRSSKQRDRRAN